MKSLNIFHLRHSMAFLLLSVAVLPIIALQNLSAEFVELTLPTLHSKDDITALAKGYEAISSALVSDDLGLANAAAFELSAEAQKRGASAFGKQAMTVAEAKSLVIARTAFKPLSEAMIQIAGNQGQYVVMVCPMVEDGRWLQSALKTQNPYMGQRMPNCGKPISTIQNDGKQVAAPEGCCGS